VFLLAKIVIRSGFIEEILHDGKVVLKVLDLIHHQGVQISQILKILLEA
jgi:hypothetical protein